MFLKRKVKLVNERNEAAAKNKPSIDRVVCTEIVGAKRRAGASRFEE